MRNVITISRQMGSGGRITAGLVAERLNWRMVGSEVVTEAARQSGFEEAKLERVFARRVSLEDRLIVQQSSAKYLGAISAAIIELAQEGNVVILGRGAGVIMADNPRIFRVHLVAELETRIARIAAQLGLKGSKGAEEARRRVLDSDYARTAYHKYLFDTEWNDPLSYELVLNTGTLRLQQATDIILEAFHVMEKGA